MISSFAIGRYAVKIYQDENAESPREWDNLGRMVCFHRRYELGDRHDLDSSDFSGWGEVREYLIRECGAVVILPLFLFDHSGLSISAKSDTFRACDSAGWDWGQVGFIYASQGDVLKEYSVKRITKQVRDRVADVLYSEVRAYDEYLQGDVYGYVVEDEDGEHVDSCWGFYGYDYCNEEARKAAEYAQRQYNKTFGIQLELLSA